MTQTEAETKPVSVSPPPSPQKKKGESPTPLPADYSPTATTVIVGRGKKIKRHPGNRNLTAIVRSELNEYSRAEKTAKSFILMRVLKMVQDSNSNRIGFVKQDNKSGQWMSLPVNHARACVAQEFRDALHSNYRSSKHSKQRRRMQEKGYDFVPTSLDAQTSEVYGEQQPAVTEDKVSLISGLVQGFHHRRATSQFSQRENINQIRNLIHIPARKTPSAFASNNMSYTMGDMMQQPQAMFTNRAFGLGGNGNGANAAAYSASEFTSKQLMGSMWRSPTFGQSQFPVEVPSFQGMSGNYGNYGNYGANPVSPVSTNSGFMMQESNSLDAHPIAFETEDDYDTPVDLTPFQDLPL